MSSSTSYRQGGEMEGGSDSAWVRILVALLCVVAAWSFLWPCRRAFLNIEIDRNEGWNAYFADAAMGRMALYPAPDQLITNNYPPLSFYIVGALGRLVGDPVLAGRILSLAAVLAIAGAVALMVRRLGGSRAGAGLAAVFFMVTMGRFCERYVGMDDPQLLAQAIMAFGFVGFLAAVARDRSCLGPILLMAVAGFIKHNIIAMPLTAFLWLGIHRPREAVKCFSIAAATVAIGFALCFAFYGRNFMINMLSSREFSWQRAMLRGTKDLRPLYVGFATALLLAWHKRRDPGVQICSLFIGIALAANFLQMTGAGVDANARFDLIIAVSAGIGLAFTHASGLRLPRFNGIEVARIALLLALLIPALPWKSFRVARPIRSVFDPAFHTEIALREKAMADSIARVKGTPGDVMCSNFVCYRAGKPFAVDVFNAQQRILAGNLPGDAVTARIASGKLTVVHAEPGAEWDSPLVANAAR